MRPGAFLVNVGRGSVVDEEAVAGALEQRPSRRLRSRRVRDGGLGAARAPGVDPRPAAAHPRTLFTPHLGSAVDDVRGRCRSKRHGRSGRSSKAGGPTTRSTHRGPDLKAALVSLAPTPSAHRPDLPRQAASRPGPVKTTIYC